MSIKALKQALVKNSVFVIATLCLLTGAQIAALADGLETGTFCCKYKDAPAVQAGCIIGSCHDAYKNDPDAVAQSRKNALKVVCPQTALD